MPDASELHTGSERLLAAEHARFAYDRFGDATSVVLDAGRVVGVWDLGPSDDPLAVRVAPLAHWPKDLIFTEAPDWPE